jgi:hypothetical protein
MELWLIILLVLAVLALGSWGYSYNTVRPAATTEVVSGPAAGPSPLIHLLGVIGLILLVAFFVMWLTGWRFGFGAAPPP